MSWKIQNYLSSYYVCLEISEEMNDGKNKMANKKKMRDRHKFYEVNGVAGRGCQWESAFASSPSLRVQSLPTEKSISDLY